MNNRKLSAIVLASSLSFLMSVTPMLAQSAEQDMKNAGRETKNAAKDTGHGVATGSKDAYHSTKRGTKKAYHKTKRGVKKAHRKMDPDRTSSDTPR